MKELEEFDNLLIEYKKQEYILSEEQRDKLMIEYVYESNKLEGNQLNLVETTKILTEDIAIGNKRLRDYLEAKGHYKALRGSITAAYQRQPLTVNLMKKFNENILGNVWSIEDSYYEWKMKGQKVGEYKVAENRIYYNHDGKEDKIIPGSNPNNVEENMKQVIEQVNKSTKHIIIKAAEIAYKIFINQPFPDGNKRTSRLMVTYMTMKEGLPLIVFNKQKGINYNEAMLLSYLEKEPSIFIKFISKEFRIALEKMIRQNKEIIKNTKKGYSLSF